MKDSRLFKIIGTSTALLGVLVISVQPAKAAFPVVDIPALIQIIKEVRLAAQIYQSSMQIYRNAQMNLEMWQYNLAGLKSRQGWMNAARNYLLYTPINDRYGEAKPMGPVLNGTVQDARPAYQTATLPVAPTISLSGEMLGTSANIANLGSVEMSDSASVSALNTASLYRQQMTQDQQSLTNLRTRAMSDDPALNTVAVRDQLRMTGMLEQIKGQHVSNALNAALLQQQVIANTYQRNAVVDALNTQAHAQDSRAQHPVNLIGIDQTLTNFELK